MAQLQSLMDDDDGSRRWALVLKLYEEAVGGNMHALKLILDRTDPVPAHNLTINNNVVTAGEVLDNLSQLRAKVANGKGAKPGCH